MLVVCFATEVFYLLNSQLILLLCPKLRFAKQLAVTLSPHFMANGNRKSILLPSRLAPVDVMSFSVCLFIHLQ